jgi:transposase-like protein
MHASQFKNLLADLPRLSPEQLTNLRAAADRLHQHTHSLSSIDAAMTGVGCPHCNSFKYTKNGICRGVQRYRCKDCSRTFNAATNTPLSHQSGTRVT